MGYQSAVLGYEFGVNYEVGKRTIKAMDNDLFNKIVAGQGPELEGGKITVNYNGQAYELDNYSEYLPLLSRLHSEQMITNFRKALPDAMSVMNDIIESSVQIEKAKAERTPSAFREIFEAFTGGFTEQQKEDLGNFFGTFSDSFSKLLGWFGLQESITTEPPNTSFNHTYTWAKYTKTQTSNLPAWHYNIENVESTFTGDCTVIANNIASLQNTMDSNQWAANATFPEAVTDTTELDAFIAFWNAHNAQQGLIQGQNINCLA